MKSLERLVWTIDGIRPSRWKQRIYLADRPAPACPPKHYLTLVAIVFNEARYLPEWIAFHANLGVEHFYIYDNGSTDDTFNVLSPFVDQGLVTLVPWPNFYKGWEGIAGVNGRMQRLAYAHALTTWGPSSRWMAFIDIDEFIVPKSTASIPEFLAGYEDLPVVCAWWVMFASHGLDFSPNAFVTEQITKAARFGPPAPSKFWRFKSFVQPAHTEGLLTAHLFIMDDGYAYGINENRVQIPYFLDSSPRFYSTKFIQINHYYDRGKIDQGKRSKRQRSVHNRVAPERFTQHILDHAITDDSATKYASQIRQALNRFDIPC